MRVPATKPEPEALTRRAVRIKNALELVRLFEISKEPEQIREILMQIANEVTKEEVRKNE